MTWLCNAVGALLVLLALRDIFHTLWHPRGFGGLARRLFTLVWRSSRGLSRGGRSSQVSGPLALVVTVLAWAAVIVVGWALIYWPHMPADFHYGSSLDPARSSDFLSAVYLSLVAVATLGLGDIVPEGSLLRLLVPLQALVGFVLLTAAISWVLQLYPALGRRRTLARRLSAMASTDTAAVLTQGDASVAAGLLDSVLSGVARVHVDLDQYGESYFFRDRDRSASFPAHGPLLADLVAAGRGAEATEVRHAAAMLQCAVSGLSATLVGQYLHLDDAADEMAVLQALAADHQHDPVRLSGH